MKFFLSKISIFFVFLFLFLFSLTAPSLAQSNNQNLLPPTNTNPDVPNDPHFSTQSTIIEIMSAISCQISGIDPLNPKGSCLGADPKTGKIGFVQNSGGAIGAMGNMISMLYTPQIHTSDYFQNLAQNFGITKTSYAQATGTGFDGLRPILSLWTAFRNIVYLIFVIVFIVIGLAIMLRVKIDPRTVMTIQNQIPKIIIGILLVTFSYAIAGFLIDLMYVTIHITGNVIAASDTKMDDSTTNNVSTATNPFAAANRSVGIGTAFKASTAVGGELKEVLETPGGRIFSAIVGGVAGSFILPHLPGNPEQGIKGFLSKFQAGNFLAKLIETPAVLLPGGQLASNAVKLIGNSLPGIGLGAVTGALMGPLVISGIATLVVFLVLAIAMLVALFRLWFTLLIAYISILIDVVFSPFWIIGGLIPGSPINVSGWIRNLVANLSVFPVVIAMFLLGKVFQDAIGDGNVAHFVPPLIGDRLSPDAIKGFISLGIVLITPNILNVIKTALKVPKIDTGLGKAIGAGVGVVTGTTKSTVGAGVAYLAGDPLTKEKGVGGIGRMLQRRFFGN